LITLEHLLKPAQEFGKQIATLVQVAGELERSILNKMLDVQIMHNVLGEMKKQLEVAEHPDIRQQRDQLMEDVQDHFKTFMENLQRYQTDIFKRIREKRHELQSQLDANAQGAFRKLSESNDECVQATLGLLQRQIMMGLLGRIH